MDLHSTSQNAQSVFAAQNSTIKSIVFAMDPQQPSHDQSPPDSDSRSESQWHRVSAIGQKEDYAFYSDFSDLEIVFGDEEVSVGGKTARVGNVSRVRRTQTYG
jgi:hypothetical protein